MAIPRFVALQHILTPAPDPLHPHAESRRQGYVKNFIRICNHSSAVNKSSLPYELSPYVQQWDQYRQCFHTAKSLSMSWCNQVLTPLICYPQTFIKEAEAFDKLFERMLSECDNQTAAPDPTGQERLSAYINLVCMEAQRYGKYTHSLMAKMGEYNLSLGKQAGSLRRLAELSADDLRIDSRKVDELAQYIGTAQTQVEQLSDDLLERSGVAMATCCIACMGLVSFPVGMVFVAVGSAAMMCNDARMRLDRMQLSQLRTNIDLCITEMDHYTSALSILRVLNEQFAQLAAGTRDVKESMKFLYDVWCSLEKDLLAIALELDEAGRSLTAADWRVLKQDIIVARLLWKGFVRDARVVRLDGLTGNDCRLALGMSEEEVAEAMKHGHEMPILEYVMSME